MRIFIESSAVFAERSGIGQFTKRLIEAYHEQYPSHKMILFGFRLWGRKFTPPIPKDKTLTYRLVRWLPGRIYTGAFKKATTLPIDTLIGATKNDVILYPNFVRWPALLNKKSIAIIHDLSFIFYGQYSSGPNKDFMLKFVPKTIKKSDHIITISESSRMDIAKYFKIPKANVSIVHPFIDMNSFKRAPKSEIRRVKKKLKLPEKYFLFMSTIEPRKNIITLLHAYEMLPKKIKGEYGLVLAGGKGWLNDEIHAKADELISSGHNIVRTGYIDDNDLAALYSGATLYTFIPHYEGFGISPLEAMACGVPVITSNNSSLPEVVGDAGVLVNATEPKETATAIQKLLKNPALMKSMIQKGYIQAAKYNAASSARQLHEAIQKVL